MHKCPIKVGRGGEPTVQVRDVQLGNERRLQALCEASSMSVHRLQFIAGQAEVQPKIGENLGGPDLSLP